MRTVSKAVPRSWLDRPGEEDDSSDVGAVDGGDVSGEEAGSVGSGRFGDEDEESGDMERKKAA